MQLIAVLTALEVQLVAVFILDEVVVRLMLWWP